MLVRLIFAMVLVFIYAMFKMKRSLHMLQQNLYNENNRYLRWVKKNIKEVFLNLDMFGILFTFCLEWSIATYLSYYFLAILVILYIVCIYNIKKNERLDQNKKPLVITSRVKRLIVTTVILYLIPCVLGLIFNSYIGDLVILLSIMSVFSFYVVFFAAWAVENYVTLHCNSWLELSEEAQNDIFGIDFAFAVKKAYTWTGAEGIFNTAE